MYSYILCKKRYFTITAKMSVQVIRGSLFTVRFSINSAVVHVFKVLANTVTPIHLFILKRKNIYSIALV